MQMVASGPIWSSSTVSKNGTPKVPITLSGGEGAKRVRLSVGNDAADASARRLQKEAELNAVNHGVGV